MSSGPRRRAQCGFLFLEISANTWNKQTVIYSISSTGVKKRPELNVQLSLSVSLYLSLSLSDLHIQNTKNTLHCATFSFWRGSNSEVEPMKSWPSHNSDNSIAMMKQNRDSQSVVRAHLGVYELPLGGVRDKKKICAADVVTLCSGTIWVNVLNAVICKYVAVVAHVATRGTVGWLGCVQ